MKQSSVRGMRDLWASEVQLRRAIEEMASCIVMPYGYSWVETPIVEHIGVFQKTLGETSDVVGKEMYTLIDKGGDTLVLRPEGTAAVMRALIQAGTPLPHKCFYTGPMFRYERPQKGRYRQFYQLGVEHVSNKAEAHDDVECLVMAHDLFQLVGVKDYTLHLATLATSDERATYRGRLVEYLNRYEDDLSDDSKRRLITNPLRILDSKDENDRRIVLDAPRLMDGITNESRAFFDSVCDGLAKHNVPFFIDPLLMRGLDYYNHTTFEFKAPNHLGSQDAFGGGGRYDGLMKQMGGMDASGIGWALGLDRLMMISNLRIPASSSVFLISMNEDDWVSQLARTLRQEGVTCEVLLGSTAVGKKMKQAHQRGATWTIVIGENERTAQSVMVRHMDTSTDTAVNIDSLVSFFQKILAELMGYKRIQSDQ